MERLAGCPTGPIVECGSGIGNLKVVVPEAVATDLFPNPWIDRTENVFRLSMANDSTAALLLFDVFHHLEYPGTALRELGRVLRPGGRLILMEPAAGWFGRVALGLFHHEPLALRAPIVWEAPPGWDPASPRYYAAQGNAWRVFRRKENPAVLEGWALREIAYLPALRWLLCGGFQGRSSARTQSLRPSNGSSGRWPRFPASQPRGCWSCSTRRSGERAGLSDGPRFAAPGAYGGPNVATRMQMAGVKPAPLFGAVRR
ncbi:MAG TPA: class I SAM-dependent methyltransferase [Opitutaceae bacterium]|nr:class I SAM-dependent methyltransferase [Opitutaceae bacterium]